MSSAAVRAEGDQIVGPSASGNAGRVIVGVGVGLGACSLEDPGVGGGLAGLWASIGTRAAIPRGIESGASTPAGHHALLVT